VFTCRYHGWSYDRDDGALRNVPFREYFESVDEACSGLVPVQVEERHGLIWATLRGGGPSVDEFLGDEAGRQLAAFELDRSVMFLDETFTLDINWKLVADGAIDVLHPKFLHPTGVGKLIETGRSVWRPYGRHGQSFNPRKKLGALVESGEPLEDVWKYVASNLMIYPNISTIAAPDHVEFWTMWPSTTTASRCTVNIRFFIREAILDEAMAERLNRSWAILRQAGLEEDFPMEASIQRNAVANPDGTFLYGRSEAACQHLHVWLERDLAALAAP
jgi:phenylpropionate dioxygenase-like ring-hydroxylating dioxygenase large terminal subunit